jgi:MoaA/NifB/PqqE/SkfB family radical SAM enzyme
MHFEQFNQELKMQQARSGDRVVINGGEPTIHPDFLQILKAAKKRNCFIDLYTNGIKLADREFTRQIVENAPMLVRIPVFGATAAKHDQLTAHKGSFDKIMKAFEILKNYDLSRDDLFIEVKLLLSKPTVKENLEIVQLFENRFPGLFYFSLNPLITSEKVLKNKDFLIRPLSQLITESEPVIQYTLAKDKQLDINLLPFCLVPEKYRFMIHLPKREVLEEHYADPFQKEALNEKFETEKCKDCFYKTGCKGFPPHYFKHFNAVEVTPFSTAFTGN